MKKERVNQENYNTQGCLMRIIEYIDCHQIVVEFQDEYKTKISTTYQMFNNGTVKNPYYPTVYNVGVIGIKYPRSINKIHTKEYDAWHDMLRRCFDKKLKEKYPTYKNVTCCKEWLSYENFYEWLHSQDNFDKWINGERWSLDKDIIIKGNKVYSPKTCCLVPININSLFVKKDANRGELLIGISKINNSNKFQVSCQNPITTKQEYLGLYNTLIEAFCVYKKFKENIIKRVAQIEFDNGNIIKECYEAMMNYEVEIDD